MIAIIIMVIMLISFTSIISYNLLSFNHNITLNNETEIVKEELVMIKKSLIVNAKAITENGIYALPYGINDATENIHRLPENIGVPLKNIKGYYFQYCPFGINDETPKNSSVITNPSGSYNVNTTTFDGREYVTHSDPAPNENITNDNLIISALIISKFDDLQVNCTDVEYDENSNKYYLLNAKVETVSLGDIKNHYLFSDLSGQTDNYDVGSENASEIFNTLSNDVSNKTYQINLTEDISLNGVYDIHKIPAKSSNVIISTNGNNILGNGTLNFSNTNIYMLGNGADSTITSELVGLNVENSSITIEKANFGGIVSNNSDIIIEDSAIITNNSQRALSIYDSRLKIKGDVFAIGNDDNNDSSFVELSKSDMVINKNAHLKLRIDYKGQYYLFDLKKSNLFVSGNITELDSSKHSRTTFFIGAGSQMHLDGANISTKGQGYSGGSLYEYEVEGLLSAGSKTTPYSTISMRDDQNKNGIIKVLNGGSLSFDNIGIGLTGKNGNYTIQEGYHSGAGNGASMLAGDDSVSVGKGIGCWIGHSFEDITGIVNTSRSASVKENNTSNWICQ